MALGQIGTPKAREALMKIIKSRDTETKKDLPE
jgi:hypothetical protein